MNTSSKKEGRTFVRELEIKAPKEAVWKALSEAAELTRWFAPRAKINGPEGGEVSWQWTNDIIWPQKIEQWREGERLLTVYDSPVDDGKGGKVPLFVDFQIKGKGGTTTLRLVQSGFGPEADFDEEFDGISSGWVIELRSLQLYLEHHLGQARQLTWLLGNFAGDSDNAWHKLIGPEGFNCASALRELNVGDHFDFTTAAGDRFSGEVFVNKPRCFVGIVKNWGNSFLRIQVESCGGPDQVWLWHASYGQDVQKIAGLQSNWQHMITKLFGDQALANNSIVEAETA